MTWNPGNVSPYAELCTLFSIDTSSMRITYKLDHESSNSNADAISEMYRLLGEYTMAMKYGYFEQARQFEQLLRVNYGGKYCGQDFRQALEKYVSSERWANFGNDLAIYAPRHHRNLYTTIMRRLGASGMHYLFPPAIVSLEAQGKNYFLLMISYLPEGDTSNLLAVPDPGRQSILLYDENRNLLDTFADATWPITGIVGYSFQTTEHMNFIDGQLLEIGLTSRSQDLYFVDHDRLFKLEARSDSPARTLNFTLAGSAGYSSTYQFTPGDDSGAELLVFKSVVYSLENGILFSRGWKSTCAWDATQRRFNEITYQAIADTSIFEYP